MVKGFPMLNEETGSYKSCILGKNHRDNFLEPTYRTKQQIELVYTYHCGPMQNHPIGGTYYFLILIDDFRRKIWVYFLKKKYETFSKLKNFKDFVEK